jgi:hypothetical protein
MEESTSVQEHDQLREAIDALQREITELRNSADQASDEASEHIKTRIQQVKADNAAHQKPAPGTSGQAARQADNQWQSIKADAAARMRQLHERAERRRDEHDVKTAVEVAEYAEVDAIDVLDFAWWSVRQAELAVLDAIRARALAEERKAASRMTG